MNDNRLYFRAAMIFVACACTAFAALVTLIVGFGRIGAGHGDATTWYVGLVIACVAWLLLFLSCVVGQLGYRRSANPLPPIWLVVDWIIFIVASAIAIWGYQG